jgi:hypothetical protein
MMLDDVQLNSENLRIFEKFFEQRLLEAGGGNEDREDLEIARDIYLAAVNDGLTPTADGGFSHLRPGTTDWTDPATIEATQSATGSGKRRRGTSGGQSSRKDMLQGLAAFAVAIVALAWFFWPSGESQGEEAMTPTVEAEAVAGDVTPTPLPTLEAELLADIVDGVKTDLVVPRTLEIKGVSFVVQPVRITAGDWPLPDDERAVSWVYGTVVNYVLGLEASPQNKELLASLSLGDELLLRMSTGSAYRFAYLDAMRVAPQASEVFRQNRPGLTLTLLGDEGQAARVIVRATYIPDSELSNGGPNAGQANGAAIGQAVALDMLELTVRAARPVVMAQTPPGHVYMAVDYEVVNNGESLPLLTSSFLHQLSGGGGLTFPLAPVTSGSVAPLPATIDAGESVAATVLYVIPQSALGETLTWSFAPSTSGPAVQVRVPPYEGSLTPLVAVTEARLQGGNLAVTFTVQAALRQVQLNANDVLAEGAALDPIASGFPWQIEAGQTGRFTLLVSPQANPVRLGLLEQGFEVSY